MGMGVSTVLKINILMSEPSFEVLDLLFGFNQDAGQSRCKLMIRS